MLVVVVVVVVFPPTGLVGLNKGKERKGKESSDYSLTHSFIHRFTDDSSSNSSKMSEVRIYEEVGC